jgi:hypothetical protein
MASSKMALSSAKRKGQTTKEGTTRRRMQTKKGKYNVHNRKPSTPKRVAECFSSEESSDEETHRPTRKCSKFAEGSDSEEVDCHTSNIKDVVEVTSSNGSEFDFQVSVRHSLLSW